MCVAIDRGHYGSDTVSTHALMRAGVLQLARWGVLDGIKAAGTPVIRSTNFYYGDEVLAVPIKPVGDTEGLYAPRRTVIDRVLSTPRETPAPKSRSRHNSSTLSVPATAASRVS